jgi:hypothetical protein
LERFATDAIVIDVKKIETVLNGYFELSGEFSDLDAAFAVSRFSSKINGFAKTDQSPTTCVRWKNGRAEILKYFLYRFTHTVEGRIFLKVSARVTQ